METKPFVQDTLFYLNFTGMNPKNQTVFAKARAALTIILGIFVSLSIILDVLITWNGVESLLEGSDTFVALAELVLKVIFLIVYRRRLDKLLDDMQKFWSVENTGKEVKEEITKMYSFVRKFRRGMKICYWSTNIVFFTKPLFTKPKAFPIKFYQPIDLLISPRYEIVYFVQFLNSVFLLSLMLSFDFLFILYITHAVCELKMLKYEFANFKINPNGGDEDRCLKEFCKLVEHHSFVLRFIKELNSIYSTLMLSEFLSSMFCICLGLFSLSGEGIPPKLDIAAKYALFLLSYAGELYIFCIGGNVIAVESASVANAVYQSDWWIKTQPNLRKAMVLVMLRAQKAEKLTVGGMLDLDLKCVTTVVRTGFSCFTFMQAMQTQDQEALLE